MVSIITRREGEGVTPGEWVFIFIVVVVVLGIGYGIGLYDFEQDESPIS